MAFLKKIERGWKHLLFGALRAYVRSRPAPPDVDWSSGPRRILFLRQDRIGDAIVSTGLWRALTAISPDVRLDVLASPRNERLIRRLPYVSDVILFDKRRPSSFPGVWRRLRRGRYDAVIDCMVTSRSMTGFLLMLATGSPRRMGVSGRGVDWGMTVCVPPAEGHIIDLLSVFVEAFGVDPATVDWRPELPLSTAERDWAVARWEPRPGESGRRLLVNVSAGEPRRGWPDERYAAVIRGVRAVHPDIAIRVVGAPSEWTRTQAIATSADSVAIPTPELEMVIGLVATSDLVFTPDTSIVHMASAFRKPAVAMFIQDTASEWGLYRTEGVNLESEDQTLRSLHPDRALDAVLTLIATAEAEEV